MPYGWKIEHNSVDISSKVSGFTITATLESYCREMTLDISDPTFYAGLDFTQVPETPAIEIFTKIDAAWVSQGIFFIERPAHTATTRSDLTQGVWGRSLTAVLSEPFAPKVSKLWDFKTTFFAICQEMCDLAGLTWDEAYSDIEDFVVYPYTYEVDRVYPIDVISELAAFAGAIATTDREGHVCIKSVDYAPASYDETLTDDDIQELSETPEWPSFHNRVRITPTGALAAYSLELYIPDNCLPADEATRIKLFCQVKDPDGNPVDGLFVSWAVAAESAVLDNVVSNTQEISITREEQRASDYYTVKTDFPPSSIEGIWAYADLTRRNNLALAGYTISGNTITLNGRLAFCDQLLIIAYTSRGIAVNHLTAGTDPEDAIVMVDIEGQSATGMVYIDNPCECPPSINLVANPTSIHVGEVASLLVYMEESGPMLTGKTVYMTEGSAEKRGTLSWNASRFGTVSITNEKIGAINEVSGVTQCELSMFPASVSSVYKVDASGNPTGANLYSSHVGKVVDLNAILPNGTTLFVNYKAQGAALNHFTAEHVGTARIKAFINSNREAVTEAEALVSIIDESSNVDGFPADWGEPIMTYVGPGGDDEDFDPEEEPGPPTVGCAPDNISDNPSGSAPGDRFRKPLEDGCTCEEICQAEFDIHDTTQGYDDGSYRTIADIIEDDYGHPYGSPPFWEDYGPLKQDALDDCLDDCADCNTADPLEWPDTNPDTIAKNSQEAVWVVGGVGPYQWSVSGTGFSLITDVTQGGINILIADETACGPASITVQDYCGSEVTGEVRCTSGLWCQIDSCTAGTLQGQFGYYTVYEIQGKYKYRAVFCYEYEEGTCYPGRCAGCVTVGACPTPIAPPPHARNAPNVSKLCCCIQSTKWEWKCSC